MPIWGLGTALSARMTEQKPATFRDRGRPRVFLAKDRYTPTSMTRPAADQMARGFVLGATAGRTTLTGEGLQHADGHSLLLAGHQPRRGLL